ncbi:MAG: hypothetical protein A4E44_00182 [Methanosaeta sp. PtaB.Bin018]|nr:MAG: hypothetical protein A4E44_00182 [Methanosaeta sp. PtaB.Bin018]
MQTIPNFVISHLTAPLTVFHKPLAGIIIVLVSIVCYLVQYMPSQRSMELYL